MIHMPYTFVPREKCAKAYSSMRISTKSAAKLCRVISRKPLSRAKRLLTGLAEEKRELGTKHYTKTAKELLGLLNSCEKNAEFLGLDASRLFVHASAHTGTIMRRRRRKAAFGSKLKSTNVEMMLIEKGKEHKEKGKVKIVKSEEDLKKVVKEVAKEVKKKTELQKETKEAQPKTAKEYSETSK